MICHQTIIIKYLYALADGNEIDGQRREVFQDGETAQGQVAKTSVGQHNIYRLHVITKVTSRRKLFF